MCRLTKSISPTTDTQGLVGGVFVHAHPSLTDLRGAHSFPETDLTEVTGISLPTGAVKPIDPVHTGPSIDTRVTGALI